MANKAAEVARRAAEIIQERGQCKHRLETPDGQVCLWGSIYTAARELSAPLDELEGKFFPLLREIVPNSVGSPWLPGVEFNDAPDTTERDVANLLLQVADRLEIES